MSFEDFLEEFKKRHPKEYGLDSVRPVTVKAPMPKVELKAPEIKPQVAKEVVLEDDWDAAEVMDLTTRGTYGKLNALGTQSGLTARNSYNFRAATGFSEARPFPIPPAFGVQRVPSRRAVPMRADFLRPSTNWNLARGSTMPYFNIHPYEFFKNSERKIVIRQQFVSRTPQDIVLSRGQMEVFIEHLQWFLERFDAEKRRDEVEDLLKEIKR